jgi:tape measure domain-containing protein
MGIGSLGAASFEFAIDSSRFVQGFTNMGASAAGFASKFVPGMGAIAGGLKKVDDGLFNVTKTTERYTRWLRDTPADMRRANEWLYTYRQEQNRLEQQLRTSEERLKSTIGTYEAYGNKIKLQTAIIAEREQEEVRLQAVINQTQAMLAKANAANNAKQIADYTARLKELELAQKTAAATTQTAKDRLTGLNQAQAVAKEQIELVKQRLASLGEQQNRVNNSYELQEERIKSLKEKRKIDQLSIEEAAKAQGKYVDSSGKLININVRLGASFGQNRGIINNFTSMLGQAASGVQTVVNKIASVGTIALGTVLGTAIQGAAASVQGFVQTGLDAYRANERLNLSLKELVASEFQTKDANLSRTDALAQASVKTKELIDWTQKLGIMSPFSQDDIAHAFQMAKALGFNIDESKRLTQTVTDWASATGKSGDQMQRIILALGQMAAKGKVAGGEVMQLTEAGIPMTQILAKAFGKTTAEIVKMQEAGLIPAKDAILAVSNSLDKDYGGAAQRASGSMDGLLNSLQDLTTVSLREFFTGTFQAIQPYMNDFVNTMTDPSVIASIREIGQAVGSVLGGAFGFISDTAIPALIGGFNMIYPSLLDAVAQITSIADAAYDWGSGLMNQYGQGILDAASYVINAVMEIANTIADWIAPHSPPPFLPKIREWGKTAFQFYADGAKDVDVKTPLAALGGSIRDNLQSSWNSADVGMFKSLQDGLSGFLGELADGGQMDKLNIIPTMLGAGSAMTQAVEEIKNAGKVSEETFRRIHDAAGPAGEDFESYARAMLAAVTANKALADAQAKLNETTRKYDDQLTPLYDKLKKIQGASAKKDQDKELKYLKELMTLQNVPGLSMDKGNVQAQIDQIETQRQIDNVEEQKNAAVKAEQEKVDAAQKVVDQTQAQFTLQQDMIAAQREQNALIREQIDLIKKQKEEEAKAEEEKHKKDKKDGSDAEAKKAAKEAATLAKADFEARLAEADTEEAKLQILKEEQAKYAEGSKEYLDLRKRIAAQEDKVAKSKDDAAKQTAKASEKEFDNALALADSADKVKMLQDRLDQLDPSSEEYAKRQIELKRATEAQGKATDQLSASEENAKLASMDRAEKIDYYKKKLEGLDKGTKDYNDTLAKLNALEKQESDAADRKAKGKGKGKGLGDGKPGSLIKGDLGLPGKINEITAPVITLGNKIKGFFDEVNARVATFQTKVAGVMNPLARFTTFLDKNRAVVGALAGVLTVLAANAAWGLLLALLVRLAPLFAYIGQAIAFVLSPIGLLLIAAAALGAAWATNFGGIRDIVASVWEKIQAPLTNIANIVQVIIDAFNRGGIVLAVKQLIQELPELGTMILTIFQDIWDGILQFANSDDMQQIVNAVTGVLQSVWTWVMGTGLPWALGALATAWTWLKGKLGEWVPMAVSWVAGMIPVVLGKLGALAGQAITWLITEVPKLFQSAKGSGEGIFAWISSLVSPLLAKLGGLVTAALAWLGPNALPMLEKGLNLLLDYVIMAGNWIIQKGLPLLANTLTNVVNWLAENLPGVVGTALGYIFTYGPIIISELTRIILSLLQRIGIWLISSAIPNLLAFIITNVPPLIQAAANLLLNLVNNIAAQLPKLAFSLMTALGRIIMQVLAFVTDLLLAVVINIPQYIALAIAAVVSVVLNGLILLGKVIWSGLNVALALFISIFAGIAGIVAGAVWGMLDAGRMMIEGLWNGIRDAWPWLADLLTGWWNGFIAWIKGILGIASPSKVFQDIGDFLVQGLRLGLEVLLGVFNWVIDRAIEFLDNMLAKFGLSREDIMAVITNLHERFNKAWEVARDTVTLLITKLVAWFKTTFETSRDTVVRIADNIRDGVKAAIEALKSGVETAINATRDVVNAAWDAIKTGTTNAWTAAGGIVEGVKSAVSAVGEAVGKFFTGEGDGTLRGIIGSAWDWIVDKIGNSGETIGNAMTQAIKTAKNMMIDAINDVIDSVNDAIDAVNSVASAVGADTLDHIDRLSKYALGTQFAMGGLSVVGEDGPELMNVPRGASITPANRTMSMFEDAAKSMIGQVGTMVEKAMATMGTAVDQAVNKLAASATAAQPNLDKNGEHVTNNITNNITKEEHHHWNMTVNTQATTSTVSQDYGTMKAYSNLSG